MNPTETPPPAPPRRKLRWHMQGGEKGKDKKNVRGGLPCAGRGVRL